MAEQALAHINPDGGGGGDLGRQDRQDRCFCRAHAAAGDTNTSMKLQEQRLTQGKQEGSALPRGSAVPVGNWGWAGVEG